MPFVDRHPGFGVPVGAHPVITFESEAQGIDVASVKEALAHPTWAMGPKNSACCDHDAPAMPESSANDGSPVACAALRALMSAFSA